MPAAGVTRRALLAGAAVVPLAAPALVRAAAATQLRIGAILPLAGGAIPEGRGNLHVVAESARMGLLLGEEDAARSAEMLGWTPKVLLSNAPGAAAATRAARRLVARGDIDLLVGGYTAQEADALAAVAQEAGVLFFNVGAASDALRGGACRASTFHVAASAAMYLDAIAGWFVRAGFRRWSFVQDGTEAGEALYARMQAALRRRHWGAQEVARSKVRPDNLADLDAAVRVVAAAETDFVLLLTDWQSQLDFLSRYEAAGLVAPVTGFPELATQTRRFLYASAQAAPNAGAGHRAMLWEATLDAYGARELNARFGARWGQPMDGAAWAAYMAVKIAYEAAVGAESTDASALAGYLASERGVFDVSKGIACTFRPWDRQLRQSLFLVKINGGTSSSLTLENTMARASLVGELPAIYMPGTDPVERLDQLGDLEGSGTCP